MKHILLLFGLLCFSFLGQAQSSSPAEDATQTQQESLDRVKVILKSGTVLYGELISYDPEVGLLVQVKGQDLFIKEEKLKKFVTLTSSQKRLFVPLQTKKFYFRTNFGILSNTNGTGSTLNISGLYQFNPYFAAGVGVGVDNYYFNEQHNIFPVFTEIKTYLMDKKAAPFVSLKTGYSFNRRHRDSGQLVARGGLFVNPTFGYRFGTRGLIFDMYGGYRFQNAYYEKAGWAFSTQEITWRRIELGMALSF